MRFRKIAKDRLCPSCKSREVHRLKREGLSVRAVCRILGLRPYWCASCDTFFLAPKLRRPSHLEEEAGSLEPGASGGANPPYAGSRPHQG